MNHDNTKITEYEIVRVENVQEYINDGWQPQGGPWRDDSTYRTLQAMVKYEQATVKHMKHPQPSYPPFK